MWFILRAKDEKTICTTDYKNVARIIATFFPCKCVVRWSDTNWGKNSELMLDGIDETVSAKAAIA